MLTREDQTIEDCLSVLDLIWESGVRHIGFKDIGVEPGVLAELNARIKAQGAVSYMEVVSTSEEACLRSARTAVKIGVDRLLGGSDVAAMLAILEGSGIEYYPFPGRPEDHPTRLRGDPEEIAEDCWRIEAAGCAGVDLLAYRAVDAPPLDLVRAARAALTGRLIIAGSIGSPERVREIAEAGVDAFTIGTAAFDGSFSPRKGALRSQLHDILLAAG